MTNQLSETAQLALDTIGQKPVTGIPSWLIHLMEHRMIERFAGVPEGDYVKNPDAVYLAMQRNVGTCLLDQYLAKNPLEIGVHGYDSRRPRTATTGLEQLVLDGLTIDSPEAVVEHMEKIVFPKLKKEIAEIRAELPAREEAWMKAILESERQRQEQLGPTMLKSGHGFIGFPGLSYGMYWLCELFHGLCALSGRHRTQFRPPGGSVRVEKSGHSADLRAESVAAALPAGS